MCISRQRFTSTVKNTPARYCRYDVFIRFPGTVTPASFSNNTQLEVLILATISRATASAPPPERALERIRTGRPALYPLIVMIDLPPFETSTSSNSRAGTFNLGQLILFNATNVQPILMDRKHAYPVTFVHNLSQQIRHIDRLVRLTLAEQVWL